jgi:hypothetical protein
VHLQCKNIFATELNQSLETVEFAYGLVFDKRPPSLWKEYENGT